MIDYNHLMSMDIPEVTASHSKRDTMLYALGLGLGADPMDPGQLQYVYERDLQALPTMALVLALDGNWVRDRDTGVDYSKVLDGERAVELHAPIPVAGQLRSKTRVLDVIDKGADKGALILSERVLQTIDGAPLATLRQTTFCRGDGGFGGPSKPNPAHATPRPAPLPDRAPDHSVDLPGLAQQALIYRLSGDYNPLHSDPEVAKAAGFDRPILHGLATFGATGFALVRHLCDNDPTRLASISGRFTAPVFPGEALRVDIWRDGQNVQFRTLVPSRGITALGSGQATLS